MTNNSHKLTYFAKKQTSYPWNGNIAIKMSGRWEKDPDRYSDTRYRWEILKRQREESQDSKLCAQVRAIKWVIEWEQWRVLEGGVFLHRQGKLRERENFQFGSKDRHTG